MLFNYLLLIILKLIIAEYHRTITTNHDSIISISSVLGTRLIFNTDFLDKLADNEDFKTIIWYKGITDLKPLVNSHRSSVGFTIPTQSRYHIVNRTKLLITQTVIGDAGFYTLKIQTVFSIHKQYRYHMILFTPNLSLFISPPSYHYHAEQKINLTCSISFFADRTYIEQSRSLFFSTWYMIIYNNDPDHYQLLPSSSTSYTYKADLFNYELNRNDHNQIVSCAFIQQQSQQTVLHNVTLINKLNVQYKAYLRGNYYFTRSFNAYSSIEINCEEFDANPEPVYTLIWILNGDKQALLNQTKHGRYFLHNATWRHRGNYTCLAENVLNNHQPVHQSFRLNIWFNEHQLKSSTVFPFQQLTPLNNHKSIILLILILIFLFACLLCILSFYCFCLQRK